MEMLAIWDGLRLTDIAARAGIAPQPMGEFVDDPVSGDTWNGAKTPLTGPSASTSPGKAARQPQSAK
jgi:hypothetical protein